MDTITSADGTPIAVKRTGSGPPLVLVHGTTGDHRGWDPVRPAFADHFTVYAIDRRGRGESGDATAYELEREFEDVAAVVDSIDDPVTLLGHSFGALCALEAALRTDNLRKLVLYEPPFADQPPDTEAVLAEMKTLLDDGENEQALVLFLQEIAQLTPAEIDESRSAPNWQDRVDAAYTAYREPHRIEHAEFDTSQFADVTTPTLLLSGSESPQFLKDATDALADVLPNSRIVVLDGQAHGAIIAAPDLFIDEVLAFVRESN